MSMWELRGSDKPRTSRYRKDVPHSYNLRVCGYLLTLSRSSNKRIAQWVKKNILKPIGSFPICPKGATNISTSGNREGSKMGRRCLPELKLEGERDGCHGA